MSFIKENVIIPCEPPRRIVLDNTTSFMAASLQNFMHEKGIGYKSVISYAPMASGKAERMVGTIMHALKRPVVENRGDWVDEIPRVLYGYIVRDRGGKAWSFRLIYRANPMILAENAVTLLNEASLTNMAVELVGESRLLAAVVERSMITRGPKGRVIEFKVWYQLLIAYGTAYNKAQKLLAFDFFFCGPCRVIKAHHPRYD